MINNQMFDVNLVEKFYSEEHFYNVEVIKAWYLFVYKLLPCVNNDWMVSLSNVNAKNKVNIFQLVTVSDEAFIRWLLYCKYPFLQEQQKLGWPKKDDGKKATKSTGSHDSKKFLSEYASIYSKVKKIREDINLANKWNNLFWTLMVKKHAELFETSSKSIDEIEFGDNVNPPDMDALDMTNNRAPTELLELPEGLTFEV
jgi:hypothetical protein